MSKWVEDTVMRLHPLLFGSVTVLILLMVLVVMMVFREVVIPLIALGFMTGIVWVIGSLIKDVVENNKVLREYGEWRRKEFGNVKQD